MREIKFRAWDTDFNKFSELPLKYEIKFLSYYTDYKWMQYTGLKDINGKEIYEGDILHDFSDELPMVVEWDDTLACFKLCAYLNSCLECEYKFYEIYLDGLEIIGNIYENPELSKGERK